MSLIEHRRWQADTIEKHNPPTVGEWNWPQMLRDDADEIERLQARVEKLEAALRIVPGFVTNRARADFVKDTLAATEQGENDG